MHHPTYKDRHTNYMEHEAHTQHPSNYGAVSMRTTKEGNGAVGGHIHADSTNRTQQSTQNACIRSKDT